MLSCGWQCAPVSAYMASPFPSAEVRGNMCPTEFSRICAPGISVTLSNPASSQRGIVSPRSLSTVSSSDAAYCSLFMPSFNDHGPNPFTSSMYTHQAARQAPLPPAAVSSHQVPQGVHQGLSPTLLRALSQGLVQAPSQTLSWMQDNLLSQAQQQHLQQTGGAGLPAFTALVAQVMAHARGSAVDKTLMQQSSFGTLAPQSSTSCSRLQEEISQSTSRSRDCQDQMAMLSRLPPLQAQHTGDSVQPNAKHLTLNLTQFQNPPSRACSSASTACAEIGTAPPTPRLVDTQSKPGKPKNVAIQSRYWSDDEHQRFLEAVKTFGAHDHKSIAGMVGTRTSSQVRSHSQKFFKKLERHHGDGLPNMRRRRDKVPASSGDSDKDTESDVTQ